MLRGAGKRGGRGGLIVYHAGSKTNFLWLILESVLLSVERNYNLIIAYMYSKIKNPQEDLEIEKKNEPVYVVYVLYL